MTTPFTTGTRVVENEDFLVTLLYYSSDRLDLIGIDRSRL